jgi:hypothetical protein
MGLGIGISKCSCGSAYNNTPELPNPDPSNFNIAKIEQVGAYVLVKINYPDCTNFEGWKILLLRGSEHEVRELRKIDPHFCDKCDGPWLVARFEPTMEGWTLARRLADTLI